MKTTNGKKNALILALALSIPIALSGCNDSSEKVSTSQNISQDKKPLVKDSSYYDRLMKSRAEAINNNRKTFTHPDTNIRFNVNSYKSDEEYLLGIKTSDKKRAEEVEKKRAKEKRKEEITKSLDSPSPEMRRYFDEVLAARDKAISESKNHILHHGARLDTYPDKSEEEYLLMLKRLETHRLLKQEELVVHVASSKAHAQELQRNLKKGEKIACPRATHKKNKVFICSNKEATQIWATSTWKSIYVSQHDHHAPLKKETIIQ